VISKELFSPAIAGTSVGLANCFPFFIGGFMQVLIGGILEAGGKGQSGYLVSGYKTMFLVCLTCAALSFIASLFVQETLVSEKSND
jgi:hypothetical protein